SRKSPRFLRQLDTFQGNSCKIVAQNTGGSAISYDGPPSDGRGGGGEGLPKLSKTLGGKSWKKKLGNHRPLPSSGKRLKMPRIRPGSSVRLANHSGFASNPSTESRMSAA